MCKRATAPEDQPVFVQAFPRRKNPQIEHIFRRMKKARLATAGRAFTSYFGKTGS